MSSPAIATVPSTEEPRWSGIPKAAFRVAFLFFGIGCCPRYSHVRAGISDTAGPGLDELRRGGGLVREARAASVAGHQSYAPGDSVVGYALLLCYAVIAGIGAAVWTAADRRRSNYALLHDGLRVGCATPLPLRWVWRGFSLPSFTS